ncbi:MAG: ABC transporter permease, partial [Thioalkalivibrio sp.]|nr:ABC transporter permease [Thioalkalivibrio sp.]
MRPLSEVLRRIGHYPSAVVGLAIIFALVGTAVFTVVTIPYGQALELWRGGEDWRMHPVNARPAWVDRIAGNNLPQTIIVSSDDAVVEEEPFVGGNRLRIPLEFDFNYGGFPSELNLFLTSSHAEREPFVRLTWETPDGRELNLGGRRPAREERVSISQDWELERRLGRVPHVGLFADPADDGPPEVLGGRYR